MRHNPLTGMMEDTVPFEEIAERIRAFHAEQWENGFGSCHTINLR